MSDELVVVEQPSLLDQPTVHVHRDETIQQQFEAFHRANPHVYRRLVDMTRQLLDQGHRRVGIGMLFEVLRWEHMTTTSSTPFKLNNTLRSRYARLLVSEHPEWDGVFETRRLHKQ